MSSRSWVRGGVPAAIAFSAYFRPQNASDASGSKKLLKNCKFHFEKVVVTVTATFKSGGDKLPSLYTKLSLCASPLSWKMGRRLEGKGRNR